MTPQQLIERANTYARVVLKYESVSPDGKWLPPPLLKKTIGKMGLKGMPGLNAVAVMPDGAESE